LPKELACWRKPWRLQPFAKNAAGCVENFAQHFYSEFLLQFLPNFGNCSGCGSGFDSACALPQTALTPRILAFRIAVKYENVRAADEGAF
jgi:hypothetical protein